MCVKIIASRRQDVLRHGVDIAIFTVCYHLVCMSVCESACLSARISQKQHVQIS